MKYIARRISEMGLPLRSVGYTAALFASLALPATAAEKNDSDFECEKGCPDIYERQISSGFNDEAAGRNVLACMQACRDDVAEDAGGWISYCDSLGRGVKDKERIPKRLQPLHDLLTYLEDESGAFRYLGLTCLNIEPRRSADRAYDKGETLVEALVVARQTAFPIAYEASREDVDLFLVVDCEYPTVYQNRTFKDVDQRMLMFGDGRIIDIQALGRYIEESVD